MAEAKAPILGKALGTAPGDEGLGTWGEVPETEAMEVDAGAASTGSFVHVLGLDQDDPMGVIDDSRDPCPRVVGSVADLHGDAASCCHLGQHIAHV